MIARSSDALDWSMTWSLVEISEYVEFSSVPLKTPVGICTPAG